MNLHLNFNNRSVRHSILTASLGLVALVGLQGTSAVAPSMAPSGVGGAGAFVPVSHAASPSLSGVGGAGAFVPVSHAASPSLSSVGGAGAFIPQSAGR